MNEIRSRLLARGNSSPLIDSKAPSGASAEAGLGSIKVSRREVRSHNSRDRDRHRLAGARATATHDGRAYNVEIINLSGGGAMVNAEFEPLLWDRVDLQLGENAAIETAVCWIKDGRLGLEFAHETRIDCSPELHAELLSEAIATNFPDVDAKEAEDKEPEPESRRGDARHPLIWRGVVHYDFDSTPVRLRNISGTGALIDSERPLVAGADLVLDLGDAGQIDSQVSWVLGEQVGLRFRSPFDLSKLARSKPEVAAPHWEQPSYLRGNGQTSPWADYWNRRSIPELKEQLEGFLKH